METFRLWFISVIHLPKIINMIVSCLMVGVFFYIAKKYNQLRNKDGDKYLSTMILYSAIYQAISRAFEAFYMISESDLDKFIYVCTKFYMPLDILSVCFLAIVAITGFLDAENNNGKNKLLDRSIVLIGFGGTIIGILITLFSFFESNSLFIVITAGVGIVFFFILLLLIARTCYNIFHTWSKMPPFKAMGFQLVLGIIALLFLILSELGGSVGLTAEGIYTMKIIKNSAFLLIGILYYFSLIKPLLALSKET